jgi:hypothetical protein
MTNLKLTDVTKSMDYRLHYCRRNGNHNVLVSEKPMIEGFGQKNPIEDTASNRGRGLFSNNHIVDLQRKQSGLLSTHYTTMTRYLSILLTALYCATTTVAFSLVPHTSRTFVERSSSLQVRSLPNSFPHVTSPPAVPHIFRIQLCRLSYVLMGYLFVRATYLHLMTTLFFSAAPQRCPPIFS